MDIMRKHKAQHYSFIKKIGLQEKQSILTFYYMYDLF